MKRANTLPRSPTVRSSLLKALGFAGLLAGAAALRVNPGLFDHLVARTLNRAAAGAGTVNWLADLITFPTIQGVGVVALASGCWFARTSPEARERLARGCIAAVAAAVAAHFLQESLPPLLKPIFDPGLDIQPVDVLGDIDSLRETSNPNAQSFPSERSTLYAGVAIAAYGAHRGIGLAALSGTIFIELARVYLGLHYPSDILGSVFLAAAIYWLAEAAASFGPNYLATLWERRSPATFYPVAFAACYCLADAFEDLRKILSVL